MKRLIIVLAAVVPIMATGVGCNSIMPGGRCGPTERKPWAMPRMSLPWQRPPADCNTCGVPQAPAAPVCSSCNGPVVSNGPVISEPIQAGPVYQGGPVYEASPAYAGAPIDEGTGVAGPEYGNIPYTEPLPPNPQQ